MKLSRVLVPVGVVVLLSACSADVEPVEEAAASPSPAAVESPPSSPEVEVDPNSAKFICEDLRLRDAYLEADDLQPHEEANIITNELSANTRALEEDAEPALREIALEHMGDRDEAVRLMIGWCKENTEPVNPTSPW